MCSKRSFILPQTPPHSWPYFQPDNRHLAPRYTSSCAASLQLTLISAFPSLLVRMSCSHHKHGTLAPCIIAIRGDSILHSAPSHSSLILLLLLSSPHYLYSLPTTATLYAARFPPPSSQTLLTCYHRSRSNTISSRHLLSSHFVILVHFSSHHFCAQVFAFTLGSS